MTSTQLFWKTVITSADLPGYWWLQVMRFFVVEIPMKMTDAGEGLEGRRDVLVPALNLPVQSEKTPASVRAPRRFPQGV